MNKPNYFICPLYREFQSKNPDHILSVFLPSNVEPNITNLLNLYKQIIIHISKTKKIADKSIYSVAVEVKYVIIEMAQKNGTLKETNHKLRKILNENYKYEVE